MARPRGEDWLEDEIVNLKQQDVQVVVSLLEQEEIAALGLGKQADLCAKHNIEYINFPIPDRGLPKQGDKVRALVGRLKEKIVLGNTIVVHCRMGIGRSSIIAGSLLLTTGYKTNALIAHISKIRGLRVPDTDEQIEWLRNQE